MINIIFLPEENRLVFHSLYENDVKVDFTAIDLNTNLGFTSWWIAIGYDKYCNWFLDPEYLKHHACSGFIVKGYIGDELVVNETFQFKKEDNRFKFVAPSKETCYGSWFNLVHNDEYKSNFVVEDIVYDLGANFGVYSMWALYHKVKQIYAFEPTPKNVECLNQTFKWDSNVKIFDKAITGKHETRKFYQHPQHSISNGLNYENSYSEVNSIDVECINLEQFIKENNLLFPTIVKCDIEGSEYEFVESCSDEFFKFIKTFIVEFHQNDGNKVWSIISKLLNLGYSIRMVDNNFTTQDMGTLIAKR